MGSLQLQGLHKQVSHLIMGSDYFEPDIYGSVAHTLDTFVALGGNTIDSAFIYNSGKSEQTIGMWVEERNNRDQVCIWTKGAHPDEHGSTMNRQAIRAQLTTSLERLRTDYVDLYALHRDDLQVPVAEIIGILNELVSEGKMMTFGASNWTWERLAEANEYARTHHMQGFSFNSPNLSLAKAKAPYWPDCISVDAAIMDWHHRTQLPLLSWSAQARGFFTGRFTPDDQSDADLVRVFYNDQNWERYNRASQFAAQKGVSTIQIALAYVLNQSFPTGAIIGPRNVEEMESCFEAARITLTPEEIAWLDLRNN